jgi:hypothetical protein
LGSPKWLQEHWQSGRTDVEGQSLNGYVMLQCTRGLLRGVPVGFFPGARCLRVLNDGENVAFAVLEPRTDVDGNLWCSSNAGRNVGYSGVTVWSPQGQLIGRIRLPEICGNVCFGGAKRNRLFMAASQSLYSVYTSTQGAAPG